MRSRSDSAVVSLLLVGLSVLHVSFSIRVFRNTVNVSETEPFGGARLASVTEPVHTEDLTICVRFKLKILGSWEYNAKLIQIEDWRSDDAEPAFRLIWLGAWYPRTFFGFGHPRVHGSYASYLLRDPDLDTYQVWNPNKWSHLCLSYEKKRSYLLMVKDGRTLNINFADPNLTNVTIPTDFLTKTYLGRCAVDYKKGCSTPEGIFTDFNVWSRALTGAELHDWTSCRSNLKGDLVNWETSGWDLVNMVDEELVIDPQRLCQPFKMGYMLFPEKRNMSASQAICQKLRGKIPIITSKDLMIQLADKFIDYFGHTTNEIFWGGWSDEAVEGEYVNINTGEKLLEYHYQPWDAGEPNGGRVENCMVVRPNRNAWNDDSCSAGFNTFCEIETPPYLRLRGLCFNTRFDDRFSWTGQMINGHHSFQGYTGTVLSLDTATNLWMLTSYIYPSLYATLEAEDYPLGSHTWKIYNDPCYEKNSTEVLLNFNACSNQEFNCIDGQCISIDSRCNGRIDCNDKSDEINCETVEVDKSYIKELPAPPKGLLTNEDQEVMVNVSVNILGVLDINEVDGAFTLQFALSLTWFDQRLAFHNLKKDEFSNTLTPKDKKKIWIPQIVFFNTENKSESLEDEKAFVTIIRQGRYKLSPHNSVENVHIYQGAENPLKITRVYSVRFLCEYDMGMYPFDQQTCSLSLVLKENIENVAQLRATSLTYLGPIDLTQYYIKKWDMFESQVIGNSSSVDIKIKLGRRILNEILTTYLPTILICIVSFSTNYFKSFFFEAIVTVNLTSMLVLTTLFISVSNNLPKTSYVKMIDIWLITVLCVPFLEVILHTIVDTLKGDEKPPAAPAPASIQSAESKQKIKINDASVAVVMTKTQKDLSKHLVAVKKDPKILKVCRAVLAQGLPILFLIFVIIYFGIGISFTADGDT